MAIIYTPVKGYTGPGVAGIAFVDGRAESDDPAVIAYAHRHGYEVEETKRRKAPAPKPTEPATSVPPAHVDPKE